MGQRQRCRSHRCQKRVGTLVMSLEKCSSVCHPPAADEFTPPVDLYAHVHVWSHVCVHVTLPIKDTPHLCLYADPAQSSHTPHLCLYADPHLCLYADPHLCLYADTHLCLHFVN